VYILKKLSLKLAIN